MADNFGLKIGLEGEKQFKSQIAEITQTFKVLGSEMKLVESQFSSQDKSQEALTARNEVLNRSIDTQKEKIETVLRLNSIGLDVSQIAVGAGITVEEVESIIDRNISK